VINIDAIVAVLQTVRQLIAAPWLKKAALSDMLALIKAWESEYEETYRAIPEQSQNKFVSWRIASFVRSSNKLEQTSAPYSQGTYKSLVNYASAGEHASEGASSVGTAVVWDSEGEDGAAGADATLAQAQAHVNGVRLLYPRDTEILPVVELTADLICQMHQVVFKGSVANGRSWLIGEFRSENLCAGGYDFRQVESKEEMQSLVEDLLKRLRAALASDQQGFAIATWFTNAFLMLHPFQNGNGRISRLLFAYIVSTCHGIPHPTVLSSGGSKSRKHFYSALKRMQQRVPPDSQWMLAIAVQSVNLSIICVKNSFKLGADADADGLLSCDLVAASCDSSDEE